jgi:D-glycero-D-manno-heptose 1,7-bisphosphate phosphatase
LPSRKAVFLDRDGTLNVNFGYVHRRQDWEWIDGAIKALKSLQSAGFELVIVTNQAGIARGYYQPSDVEALHNWMQGELAGQGVKLSGIYYCPHHPDFGEIRQCSCRKPQSGMLVDAARDLNLDLPQSWIIGDQMSDALAGLNTGTKAVVIGTQTIEDMMQSVPDRQDLLPGRLFVEPTISAAAALILAV